jgi:enediyne biosynthesis protein E9
VTQRVDVCIVGSGFGGSIAAWRLAELYRAHDRKPSVVVLERGRRKGHTDFAQSLDIANLSSIYELIQGQGAQVVTANLVGGGSNLYLAASLRAPSTTFERTDSRPDDGPRRRMWPKELSRRTLDPFYARAERGLRVTPTTWDMVSKSGGIWAAMLRESGYTCDRVPLAISRERCVNAKWCYTGCVFGAKNSVITNYLASAELAGVEVRPLVQVNQITESSNRPYRYVVQSNRVDPDTKGSAGNAEDIECKVVIMAAGAMGSPPILMRSQQTGGLGSLSGQLGKHLGVNGDHVAAIEMNPGKVRDVLGLPRYGQFYKGRPITVMSYDFHVGKRGARRDGTRFTLQEILLSQLTNFLYDDGRKPEGGASWFGRQKKRSISTWSDHLEILAMVEDTDDGTYFTPPPLQGDFVQPNGGPVGIGTYVYEQSEQSVAIREQANRAIEQICKRRGLAKFLKLTETAGVYAAHPLGGCRMADSEAFGVVNHRGEAFGYEGLFVMDSSIIPTSLCVNPSLTISAVCERAAAKLIRQADDYSLPRPPKGFRFATPPEHVGERVHP